MWTLGHAVMVVLRQPPGRVWCRPSVDPRPQRVGISLVSLWVVEDSREVTGVGLGDEQVRGAVVDAALRGAGVQGREPWRAMSRRAHFCDLIASWTVRRPLCKTTPDRRPTPLSSWRSSGRGRLGPRRAGRADVGAGESRRALWCGRGGGAQQAAGELASGGEPVRRLPLRRPVEQGSAGRLGAAPITAAATVTPAVACPSSARESVARPAPTRCYRSGVRRGARS